jgi:hypothetical protein
MIVVVSVVGACGRLGFDLDTTTRTTDGSPTMPTADGTQQQPGSDAMESTVCSGFICDSFEGGAIDPKWDLQNNAGTAMLDTTRAHTGTQSVHLATTAITMSTSSPYALLHTEYGLPFTGQIYTRVWVYLQSPQPDNPLNEIIDFSTLAGLGISTGARNGFFVNNDYTSMEYMQSTTATVPFDTWVCLEFDMPSGTSGSTHVSINGSGVDDLTLSKTSTQPAPQQVFIGTEWAATVTSQPQADLWIDDVILSTSPTNCLQE